MTTVSLNEKHRDFFQAVFEIVKQIPVGRATSYGAIAACLGSAKSSRMVGWAMNASHRVEGVPAHRVVNRNGMLTGKFHFDTPELMQKRLENEGVVILNDKIVDWKNVFWDPFVELQIKETW